MAGRIASAALAALMLVVATWTLLASSDDPAIVIGKVPMAPEPVPEADPGRPAAGAAQARPDPMRSAGGRPPGAPLAFRGAVNVPDDLLFFLVVGSDARPGQSVTRSRADSIHVVAVDPKGRVGTILGLPRDSYVDVPGHGKRKILAALPLGGPELLVRTVRDLTGLPVSHYAVTGFQGIVEITDALGGVDIEVPYRMADRYSGAYFEPGWHRMDGHQVLAFSRARKGVPRGDFGRSENHGRVMLHALAKMGAEVSDAGGVRRWLEVLYHHAQLDMSIGDAIELGVLARQILPADLRNVVASGSTRSVGGQSVVVLDEAAYALFRDVGANALADGSAQREAPSEAPAPTPAPEPTPAPTPEPTPTPTPILDLPGL